MAAVLAATRSTVQDQHYNRQTPSLRLSREAPHFVQEHRDDSFVGCSALALLAQAADESLSPRSSSETLRVGPPASPPGRCSMVAPDRVDAASVDGDFGGPLRGVSDMADSSESASTATGTPAGVAGVDASDSASRAGEVAVSGAAIASQDGVDREGSVPTVGAASKASSDNGDAEKMFQALVESVCPRQSKKTHIKRPMNAFMIFSTSMRGTLREQHPEHDNKMISRMLGDMWSELPDGERQKYLDMALRIKTAHRKAHPDWKYNKARKPTADASATSKPSSKAGTKHAQTAKNSDAGVRLQAGVDVAHPGDHGGFAPPQLVPSQGAPYMGFHHYPGYFAARPGGDRVLPGDHPSAYLPAWYGATSPMDPRVGMPPSAAPAPRGDWPAGPYAMPATHVSSSPSSGAQGGPLDYSRPPFGWIGSVTAAAARHNASAASQGSSKHPPYASQSFAYPQPGAGFYYPPGGARPGFDAGSYQSAGHGWPAAASDPGQPFPWQRPASYPSAHGGAGAGEWPAHGATRSPPPQGRAEDHTAAVPHAAELSAAGGSTPSPAETAQSGSQGRPGQIWSVDSLLAARRRANPSS